MQQRSLFLILFAATQLLAEIPGPCVFIDDECRSRAIWEQPVCPECPENSGRPISYGRTLECALVKIKPFGYVKWETYFDTRQPLGTREENSLFYPAPYLPDIHKQDINAHGKWHMTAFETRVGLELVGPEWNGIKTDGLVEGDFRGIIDATISDFRLRNAFGRVLWKNAVLLFGKWWHPLWIPECFPHTVGFDIGAPMDPQARDPQIKLTQRWNWFELIVAACGQRDFSSPGPVSIAPTPNSIASPSTFFIREAVIPNLHVQMRGYFDCNLIGVAADYKRLTPRLVSNNNVAVSEHIDSFIVEGFASFNYAPWSLRMKGIWSQNGADQLLISGYGVRSINAETDCRSYSNTAAAAGWIDFSYLFCCDNHELGLFVGGTKNLGSRHKLYVNPTTGLPIIYALQGITQNMDYEVRFVPRYIFMKDPIRFGLEVDYIRTSWGTPNACGKVENGIPVNLVRILAVLYYMF